ncbi:hypothetical protein [Butyrivibrio sp. AC2005]|uniref:hypothetical protein n=1 Tax=Butyrivibrio sp. AC2005 TaxID=1280672 RepID=UPI0005D1F8F6|nr:hypothetical protein [Butyrivibrio sp. AC2005]
MKCNKKIFYRCLRVFPIIIISSLLLCGCPSGNTSQNGFMSHNTITEGDFRIYNKTEKAALVEAFLWDGTMGSLTIDVPDETSEGIKITELGGRIGIGVPDEFGIEFKPLDDSGFEPKYLPSLSQKLTPEMEEENEKLRQEYLSDQWLYDRTEYYKGTDDALYDGHISFEELKFTVNLGKNIEGVAVLDYSRTKPEWAYLGIRQDDGNIIFYQPVYSFNCDKDNQNFYSKEGKLYSKETNEELELNYPDGVAEPEDYMGNANANDGDETADVVRIDEGAQNMVRTDTWAATAHLSDKKAMELTLPARDGEPVKISFTDNNEQGKSDGGKGGVDVSYALAYPESNAPDSVKKILDEYNSMVNSSFEDEMKKAEERWDKYHEKEADALIYLSPKLGIQLMRSDTSILSFVTTNSCYNRGYEPDYNLFYGHTYDVQTGRKLTLSDFITDMDSFSAILCRQMALQSYGAEESERQRLYLSEDFEKLVLDSLNGCRDDGLFAWAVSPIGFEFFFSNPFYAEGYILNDKQQIFIPFSFCTEFMYQDAYAEYDYVVPVADKCLSEMLGVKRPLKGEDNGKWHVPYMVKRNGKSYLYMSGNKETLTYDLTGDSPEYVGSVIGMINYPTYEIYESVIDPEDIELGTSTVLLVELLQLKGRAKVGNDGQPVLKELFRPEYNSLPIMTQKDIKAEAFADENAVKSKVKKLPEDSYLSIVRTDAETFIDVIDVYEDDDTIYRLYITGNDEDGFKINGEPAEDLVTTGYFTE